MYWDLFKAFCSCWRCQSDSDPVRVWIKHKLTYIRYFYLHFKGRQLCLKHFHFSWHQMFLLPFIAVVFWQHLPQHKRPLRARRSEVNARWEQRPRWAQQPAKWGNWTSTFSWNSGSIRAKQTLPTALINSTALPKKPLVDVLCIHTNTPALRQNSSPSVGHTAPGLGPCAASLTVLWSYLVDLLLQDLFGHLQVLQSHPQLLVLLLQTAPLLLHAVQLAVETDGHVLCHLRNKRNKSAFAILFVSNVLKQPYDPRIRIIQSY